MGCYQGRELWGRICDLQQRFGAVYQEQESWFLCVSTKPAQCDDASPVMGPKTNPQTVVPPRECWSCGSGISLVAEEKRRKPGLRLVAATNADVELK